ncbi:MAG TPA: 30S ribosomal protein S21 [Patescibacteria group bacterium]|nr:30S ribosomal protein S21 [Patescibacteria group bacterium]
MRSQRKLEQKFAKFMFILKKKKGESEDKLIARFRKKTIMEGVMQEYRDRESYKKPSEKRKEAKYRIAHSIELEKKRSF